MATPRVLLLGQDLYALGYVREIIRIREEKTYQRSKLIQNAYDIRVSNINDFFSVNNPTSIFYNVSWRYATIEYWDETGERAWLGVLEDIERDHNDKTATLITKNSLAKFMDAKVSYTSSAWETPGEAAKNLMDAYSYTDYDSGAIVASINQQTANSCYIKAHFLEDSDTSFQHALEKLAEAGCADFFSHNGVLFYKHYKPFTGGVSLNLTASDLARAPVVSSLIGEIINDYRIYYSGAGSPVTDSGAGIIGNVSRSKFSTHSLPEMGGGADDQIEFKDSTSAQYIGECYINRSHIDLASANVRPPSKISFSIPLDFREYVTLETYFRLTFSGENWTNHLFEIFNFERNPDADLINIEAYEVDE